MGKALMVRGFGAVVSGSESNLFGNGANATEANTQYSATEGASFTKLGFRIGSGGSGTNTVQFRDAGVNGQNVASRTGTGTAEDATHTDTLTAGDLFNLAMTDTGTDPTYDWLKTNVEFTSSHGCFHGAAAFGGVICDVASSTRYFAINGDIGIDGSATIANVQWKNRGYTSLEAFQVNVSANLRANDSVFRVNINGVDTGTAITYAASATGLQSATGMGISLADGDLVCISMTLGTGVEDLTLTQVGVTLKSTAIASEVACGSQSGLARAASATNHYYLPGGVPLNSTIESSNRITVGFPARCKNLRCYLGANTYTADATLKLMVNGVAQITTTITAAGGAGWYENAVNTYDITDTDGISYEIDGGTGGSITIHSIGVTLAVLPATGTITAATKLATQSIATTERFTGTIAAVAKLAVQSITATERFTGTIAAATKLAVQALSAKEVFTGTVAAVTKLAAQEAAGVVTNLMAGAESLLIRMRRRRRR